MVLNPDHSIFVGNLSGHVTDDLLQETFRARYNSVVGPMTVTDRRTGRSKGYGFVRFADEGEQMRAITEMQGVLCSTRPMRIKLATNKKPAATTQPKGLSFIFSLQFLCLLIFQFVILSFRSFNLLVLVCHKNYMLKL
jgi:RNA recognition motif-containing protein